MSPCKPKNQVDVDIVDLVKKLSKEEKEQETLMKTEINDAVHKWCATYPAAHQMRVAHVAFKFRCRISSIICFLVAAYRLLAKAPWTTNIIAVDIKQAAFYAISKGWSLKDPTAGDFPFCENHVRELRTFFTVVREPNIHTFSVLSETLPDFFKSKLC